MMIQQKWIRGWALLLALAALGSIEATGPRVESRTEREGAPRTDIETGAPPVVKAALGHLPLSFEPNQGQSNPEVKFLSRGVGYALFLTSSETVLGLHEPRRGGSAEGGKVGLDREEPVKEALVRMKFLGANLNPKLSAEEELPGKSNYFIGSDPQGWRTGVPQYRRVRYEEVYPGVDLVYYGSQRQLEHDWVVRPGADPDRIRMRFEGAAKLALDNEGNLLIGTEGGNLVQRAPVVYQEENGRREPLSGRYVLKGEAEVSFEVEGRDASKLLVIDPVLAYSSYLGGNADDIGSGIAVDSSGNTYLTGYSRSTNFPTVSPIQPNNAGGYDAFITKLDPAGALIYSTYLGGSGSDFGNGIAVDSSGNAYLTGNTSSTNFPTVSPLQASLAGTADAFVAKLNPAGSSLIRSTYMGGSGTENGSGIVVDGSGNAFVTGYTTSTNFPTRVPLQPVYGGGLSDAFVLKMSLTVSTFLVYSTYVGGNDYDLGIGIAVDSSGSAYLTGYTASTNFPTAIALQPTNRGGFDAFVTKLNAAGSALVYSTYLGGSNDDLGFGIAVDSSGSGYFVGYTNSTNFPTANALQPSSGGSTDGFVTKLNPLGISLLYSTYLGGSGFDYARAIAVDSFGNAYLTGVTSSPNFPTSSPLQPSLAGSTDAFVAKLNGSGNAFVYSTFLGGSTSDFGYGVALTAGAAVITGYTNSTNFPTANAFQPSFGGGTWMVSWRSSRRPGPWAITTVTASRICSGTTAQPGTSFSL